MNLTSQPFKGMVVWYLQRISRWKFCIDCKSTLAKAGVAEIRRLFQMKGCNYFGSLSHQIYPGYQRFFLACDEELRRPQAHTSSAFGGSLLRLDQNQKPRMKSLWHPGYIKLNMLTSSWKWINGDWWRWKEPQINHLKNNNSSNENLYYIF